MLVINQILGGYQCKNPTLVLYLVAVNKPSVSRMSNLATSREKATTNELAQIASGTTIDGRITSTSFTVFKISLSSCHEQTGGLGKHIIDAKE